MDKPLRGLRILDLTHVWAGPLATRILGDMGAQVLKLEASYARGLRDMPSVFGGMFPNGDPGDEYWNRHGLFNKLNRNKKGLCVNLKEEQGKALFLGLVSLCDVVIENFSAAAMGKLNLDYEILKQHNDRIIYVAMPGYGTCGPYSDFVAFGPSVEPMTGLTTTMGYNAGELRTTAMALPDAAAGVTAAAAVVTALAQREQTGEGCYLDLSLHEAAINLFGERFIETQLTGDSPEVKGNQNPEFAPQGIYRCAGEDEWIAISCPTDETWQSMCEYMDMDWNTRGEFLTDRDRQLNHEKLNILLTEFTKERGKLELMKQLQKAGVPAGAVMTAPEFMSDPHIVDQEYFTELGDDHVEHLPFPGSPVRFDSRRASDWVRAPRLGEHNHEVLEELLGLDRKEIKKLEDSGIITNIPPTMDSIRQE
jgi:crotonobetainyl-CoA:carnitine CoA-transferase CaiB-like acyl-CoA transferase